MNNDIKKFIYKYSIKRNKKWVENGIIGWRTALAHARKHAQLLLFEPDETIVKVEILNLWTGEIITLEEAEKKHVCLSIVHPHEETGTHVFIYIKCI